MYIQHCLGSTRRYHFSQIWAIRLSTQLAVQAQRSCINLSVAWLCPFLSLGYDNARMDMATSGWSAQVLIQKGMGRRCRPNNASCEKLGFSVPWLVYSALLATNSETLPCSIVPSPTIKATQIHSQREVQFCCHVIAHIEIYICVCHHPLIAVHMYAHVCTHVHMLGGAVYLICWPFPNFRPIAGRHLAQAPCRPEFGNHC